MHKVLIIVQKKQERKCRGGGDVNDNTIPVENAAFPRSAVHRLRSPWPGGGKGHGEIHAHLPRA